MKSRFLFPAFHCHAYITNQLFSKVVASSTAENEAGPKRAQEVPQNQRRQIWKALIPLDSASKMCQETHRNLSKKIHLSQAMGH